MIKRIEKKEREREKESILNLKSFKSLSLSSSAGFDTFFFLYLRE